MLLPAMNVPGFGHYLFSGGTAALKGVNTVITKESYLNAGQFKLDLRKDTDYPTIDYLNLELAPRATTKRKKCSRRGSFRSTQYRRGRVEPPHFSVLGQ